MSQRARVLLIVIAAMMPLAITAIILLWRDLRDGKERIASERIALAQAAALAAGSYVEGNLSTIRALALMPTLRGEVEVRDLTPQLARVAAENSQWEGIGVIGPDGYPLDSSTDSEVRVFVGDRPYFLDVVASGQPTVSSALIGRASGKPTMALAAPLELASGGRGVLVAPMRVDRIADDLRAQIRRDARRIVLVDREGQTFMDPDPERVNRLAPVRGRPDVEAALSGQTGSLVLELNGAETLVAYAPVPSVGWAVLVVEPVARAFEPAETSFVHGVAVLALALATVGATAWYLSRRAVQSYERMVDATAQAEQAVATRDEFLASASHDLRNPVTSIKTTAQVLLLELGTRGSIDPARLQSSLANVDAAAPRMTDLISGFLDVARLQIGRPLDLQRSSTDLAVLTRQVADECQRTTNRHRIVVEGEGGLVGVWDGPRLQRVVSNVLDNAVKYSPEGGDITVLLSRAEGDDPHAVIAVRDHGLGIPPEDVPRIFDRFSRGRAVAAAIPGSGIGLTGARQIVEQHGGTISIESLPGGGTTVIVRLPLNPDAASPDGSEPAHSLPPQGGG